MPLKKNLKIFSLSIGFLVLISIITYFPYSKHFGFISDDWYLVFGGETFGASRFLEIFSTDRPFRGYLQSILFNLFELNINLYFILALLIRLLGAIGLHWTLSSIWKNSQTLITLISAIFLVFPGFLEQPHVFDYQAHQFAMTLMIFSIAFSIKSVSGSKIWQKITFYLLSSLFAILSYLLMEYYIGMESYRFLFIGYLLWILKDDKIHSKFRRIILNLTPLAIPPLLYLRWRIFIFEGVRPATNIDLLIANFSDSTLISLVNIFKRWFIDIGDVSFGAFVNPIYQLVPKLGGRDFLTAVLLALFAVLIMFLFLKISKNLKNEQVSRVVITQDETKNIVVLSFLGLTGAIICLLPINIAGRDVSYILFNRFSFPSALGISIFFVGISSVIISRKIGYTIIAILLFSSVFTQYANNSRFADDWIETQNFWQNFIWRAPGLMDGTTLTGFYQGTIQEGYSIWAPTNLIYRFGQDQILISAEVLNKDVEKNIELNLPYKKNHRSFEFQHDYNKTLVFSKPTENSCLRLIDHNQIEISLYDDVLIQLVAPFSKVEMVVPNDQINYEGFKKIFDQNLVEDSWCYYYETASLARQFQNWTEIVDIASNIEKSQLHPFDSLEWMPFIQAYVYQAQYEKAENLIKIINETPYYRNQACINFSNLLNQENSNKVGNEYLIKTFCH